MMLRDGKTLSLGPTEYRLLRHFLENAGRVFHQKLAAMLKLDEAGAMPVEECARLILDGALAGHDAITAQADTPGEPVMLRDPRLDELVAAHRHYHGANNLQMPAGFLRNATFASQQTQR